MFIRDVRRSGRWFPERGCIWEHQIVSFGNMILRGRRSTLDRWTHTTLLWVYCYVMSSLTPPFIECIVMWRLTPPFIECIAMWCQVSHHHWLNLTLKRMKSEWQWWSGLDILRRSSHHRNLGLKMRPIGARTPRGSWARPARAPWLTDCEYLNAILNCTSRIVSPTVGARLMQVSDMFRRSFSLVNDCSLHVFVNCNVASWLPWFLASKCSLVL